MKLLVKNHLLVFAFGFLGLLILAGTIIINVFWSGCVKPPLAQDNATIKDYMTLYLSMLGVVATLYASFVVIYAYDAWKEQHNKSTLAELSRNIYNTINELNLLAFYFRSHILKIDESKDECKELILKSDYLFDQLKLLSNLIKSDELQKLNEDCRTSIYGIVLNPQFYKMEKKTVKEIKDIYYKNYNDFYRDREKVKDILCKYIMV
ncbi:hypothetical protein AB7B61_11345 [Acinetobacter baumannii]|uniref:hypothetical protein n=1 Tax=Acinetobacter baumannii TaxID=470 RepID=UPI001F0955DC|nr:hypothetical protein [Acinetobacter baumannii]MCT9356538.1 hypothetical protein [Acinetobacter baumannii]UMN44523.1 hypothetical protein L2Z14_10390 [Acinetobacter baumannii]